MEKERDMAMASIESSLQEDTKVNGRMASNMALELHTSKMGLYNTKDFGKEASHMEKEFFIIKMGE